ncbi:hypothetical protein J2X72_004323 [Phyllobacterium sp. 1468]|uniref:hypothetical protein n=1 Tax=Phyllobacterium sp. 1468 TaxID=2817759 RepID=UPI0028602519|nr:hypothetical protein [Phyllobacterium sp. 1468]MDR6635509.1 hypothetical protein [Phyllobacterium sp. 1468]
MRWIKGEPELAMTDAILVTHKQHGLMLAIWQEHRGSYIGAKATGDTHGPFFSRYHRAWWDNEVV